MEKFLVTIQYEAYGSDDLDAVRKIGRYDCDLVYKKTQELKEILGETPEVKVTNIIAERVVECQK